MREIIFNLKSILKENNNNNNNLLTIIYNDLDDLDFNYYLLKLRGRLLSHFCFYFAARVGLSENFRVGKDILSFLGAGGVNTSLWYCPKCLHKNFSFAEK